MQLEPDQEVGRIDGKVYGTGGALVILRGNEDLILEANPDQGCCGVQDYQLVYFPNTVGPDLNTIHPHLNNGYIMSDQYKLSTIYKRLNSNYHHYRTIDGEAMEDFLVETTAPSITLEITETINTTEIFIEYEWEDTFSYILTQSFTSLQPDEITNLAKEAYITGFEDGYEKGYEDGFADLSLIHISEPTRPY